MSQLCEQLWANKTRKNNGITIGLKAEKAGMESLTRGTENEDWDRTASRETTHKSEELSISKISFGYSHCRDGKELGDRES